MSLNVKTSIKKKIPVVEHFVFKWLFIIWNEKKLDFPSEYFLGL